MKGVGNLDGVMRKSSELFVGEVMGNFEKEWRKEKYLVKMGERR